MGFRPLGLMRFSALGLWERNTGIELGFGFVGLRLIG